MLKYFRKNLVKLFPIFDKYAVSAALILPLVGIMAGGYNSCRLKLFHNAVASVITDTETALQIGNRYLSSFDNIFCDFFKKRVKFGHRN